MTAKSHEACRRTRRRGIDRRSADCARRHAFRAAWRPATRRFLSDIPKGRVREDLALQSERILPPDGRTPTVSRT